MPQPEPAIVQSVNRFRAALLAAERESAVRLVSAYGGVYQNLQDKIRALEADIIDIGMGATPAQVAKLARYRELMRQVAVEMDKFAVILENEVSLLRTAAARQAAEQAATLIQQALPAMPDAVRSALVARLNRLPVEAMEVMLGQLAADSPLSAIFAGYGAQAAQSMSDALLHGVALGYSPRKVADTIRRALGGDLSRALAIARTETLRAYRMATLASYKANSDLVKGWIWTVTKDTDPPPCLACLALDGQEFPLDEEFMPSHVNCILPGNEVMIPDLVAASKAFYVGRCVEVVFANGRSITVTKNHPILTPRGWVAAERLRKGDDVIVARDGQRIAASINPHYDYRPTAIEQVFDALVKGGGVTARSVKVAAEDFHGDARGFKGNVDVVDANSLLGGDVQPVVAQAVDECEFNRGGADKCAFIGLGTCLFGGNGVALSTPSDLRSGDLGGSLRSNHSSPFERLSLGLVTGGDTSGKHAAAESPSVNTDLACQFVFRFASDVATEQIVNVRDFEYKGHVYDLQADLYSLYTCNGVVVKNCRCSPRPKTLTYRDLGIDADDPPDGYETGKQWFESLPESEQRRFFGKAAWEAYKAGEVKLEDFIGIQQSKEWGPAYVERSLKDILGK
jgi:hypothetical protein